MMHDPATRPSRRKIWALGALLFGISLLLARSLLAEKHHPAIVILCATGGVYRLHDSGFLASGGDCVLHDRQGRQASAEGIIVYESPAGAP